MTGGMLDKVRWSITISRADEAREVRIFSGAVPGNVLRAILGEALGTRVKA